MRNESDYEKALRLKGYGSPDRINKSQYKDLESAVKISDDLTVKPKVITSLVEYVKFVGELKTTYTNPVFYRGQGNANYPINSNSLRINPARENEMIVSFSRKFSNEVESCKTDIERLVLMQHYGLSTRALDITESPLAALYFACSPTKKFRTHFDEDKHWGEVTLFREEEDENSADKLKTIHDSSVSIISSTAFMAEKFNLWKLSMEWKKDNNFMRNEIYIPLKQIIRHSEIVRVPQNNPRIKNQQGAFILVNANQIAGIDGDTSRADKLTEYIIDSKNNKITFSFLQNSSKNNEWKNQFEGLDTWDLNFKKVKPYSDDNSVKIFRTDPFNLRRLFYKDDGGNQLVVLIPPECKEKIVGELAKFNITEDFIYPDMDNVANEINEKINV